MAPGLTGIVGGRPTVYPLIRLFSFLIDKTACTLEIDLADERHPCALPALDVLDPDDLPLPFDPPQPTERADASVALIKLAVARSGDKGNHSNIGVMARHPDYLPWIAEALTPEVIVDWMSHVLDPIHGRVERWYLPGTQSFNFSSGERTRWRWRGQPADRSARQGVRSTTAGDPDSGATAHRRSGQLETIAMAYDSIYKPDLFAGQNIIVTGGGSGIGRCTAHELAALGAHVLLVGRNVEKLKKRLPPKSPKTGVKPVGRSAISAMKTPSRNWSAN